MLKTPSMRKDDSFVRIHYVRYADDFVIGIDGSYNLANNILQKIETFVKETLHLEFNPDKTSILKFTCDPFRFLGFFIHPTKSRNGLNPVENLKVGEKIITRRKKIRIRIEMDTDKVLKKLAANGFIRKRTSHERHEKLEYRGKFKGNLVNLDHPDILRYYNSVLRGVQNYYKFSKNRIAVTRVG